MKSFAIALLLRAVAYRLALDVVVPANSPRRPRVTLANALLAALLLTGLTAMVGIVGIVPGSGLVLWVVPLAAWLWVFAIQFELRGAALGVVALFEVVAMVAAKFAAWWLWR